MNLFVLDASVIIKWLIPENPDEQNVAEALALLYALSVVNIGVAEYGDTMITHTSAAPLV